MYTPTVSISNRAPLIASLPDKALEKLNNVVSHDILEKPSFMGVTCTKYVHHQMGNTVNKEITPSPQYTFFLSSLH